MNSRSMAGWIGFAGILMVLLGGLSFFQGLIALLEDNYYVPTQAGYLVFDITAWGWIMLIWGIVLALVGLALLGGASWARWVSILLVGINVLANSAFSAHQRPGVAADHADVQHHHPLRPDRPMARQPAGATDSLRTPDAFLCGGAARPAPSHLNRETEPGESAPRPARPLRHRRDVSGTCADSVSG